MEKAKNKLPEKLKNKLPQNEVIIDDIQTIWKELESANNMQVLEWARTLKKYYQKRTRVLFTIHQGKTLFFKPTEESIL